MRAEEAGGKGGVGQGAGVRRRQTLTLAGFVGVVRLFGFYTRDGFGHTNRTAKIFRLTMPHLNLAERVSPGFRKFLRFSPLSTDKRIVETSRLLQK